MGEGEKEGLTFSAFPEFYQKFKIILGKNA